MIVRQVARLGHDVAQQPGGQQVQVGVDGDVGVADVGGGLGQRQREHPQGPGQLARILPRCLAAELCLQVGPRFLRGEDGDLDGPAALPPRAVSRSRVVISTCPPAADSAVGGHRPVRSPGRCTSSSTTSHHLSVTVSAHARNAPADRSGSSRPAPASSSARRRRRNGTPHRLSSILLLPNWMRPRSRSGKLTGLRSPRRRSWRRRPRRIGVLSWPKRAPGGTRRARRRRQRPWPG